MMDIPLALLGRSAAVDRARAAFQAATAGSLLLVAEDGLEPDVLARYLHDLTRPGTPFVAIDCAVHDGAALEVHLLGGPPRSGPSGLERLGPRSALVSAGAGTLFLRHVDELPAPVQRRLSRILRDGEARVGRTVSPIRGRVIAWSSAPLDADARQGRFRPDLLRRLGSAPLAVPPLQGRPEDVPAVVEAIAATVCAAAGRPVPAFTKAALTVLCAMPWQGNVAEVREMLTRLLKQQPAAALIQQEDVLHAFRGDGLAARMRAHVSLREARRNFERQYIAEVLEHQHWRMSDAARILGIERANLYRKTRQLGIVRAQGGAR